MGLGCNIKQIKYNAFKGVQNLVNTKTISMNNQGKITFDYTKSKKYKTKEAAYNVSISVEKKIEKWMTEQFGTDKLSKGWVRRFDNNGEISLQYSFPKYVENALNRKFAIEEQRIKQEELNKEARKQHIEDAKRAGIDEFEFSDDYMYFQYQDDMDNMADPDTQFEQQQTKIDNDFTSYREHKINLLKKLEDKLSSYRIINKSNYGTKKYKKDTYEFQDAINKLTDEIENLDVSNMEIIFQDVLNEIGYLNKVLDSTDINIIGNQDIINRVDFLHQMITGENLDGDLVNQQIWDGTSYDNYDSKVVASITKLSNKFKTKRQKIIKDLLNKDIIYQAHKDNFTKEDIQSLFENRKDINILQELFLGINSNNDSIATTLLHTTFQTNIQKTKELARTLNKQIIDLDKKLKDKNFSLDNFFEKDESGVDTGNIIHKYTRKYFKKLYEYYELNKKFNGAKRDNKASTYNKKIAWLKENTNVIDFRKLSYFKEIYGEEYADFFSFSEQEMLNYENKLKSNLGKLYDFHIQDLEKKLVEYENYKTNEILRNTRWTNKNIYTTSPWLFVQNYYSNDAYNQIPYDGGSNNTYFTFNNSRFIEFVPKKKTYNINTDEIVDTGFYNSTFEKIETDIDAFDYWENIRDIYTKHINPTYASMGQNISNLSWAKFERSFVEEIVKSKNVQGFFKNTYNSAINNFKKLWYERGYFTEKSNIKGNYTDITSKEINQLKKLLNLESLSNIEKIADEEGIIYDNLNKLTKNINNNDLKLVTEEYKKDLIDKISRRKILENYSKNLTKTTLALSDLATVHKARQETQFIADMLLSFHKSIKDKNNKDRNRSNSKLQSWINTNIYNKRAVSRGNKEDGLSAESNQRFWKYLSNSEKELLKIIRSLKKGNSDNATDLSFFLKDTNFLKKGSVYYIVTKKTSSIITKEVFEKAMEDYFNQEVAKLGIPLNRASFLIGIMKVMIFKSFVLAPVTGAFNRCEGMFTNIIRDNMGDYWTKGNLKYAKRFLALVNINKIAPGKLSLANRKKSAQIETFQKLIGELSLYQDRKNQLARKDKEARFESWKQKLNPYQFAIDNPEFKNQSEIILSMFMDVRIKDNNGKQYKFFDGTGFPAYKPGTLLLRDEFRNEENKGWETFMINNDNTEFNNFFVQKLKIEDAVKKTQGNFADFDSIKFLDDNVGKFMMLFMRWLPEHVNQRFGKRNTDIIQGRKKIVGRYRGLLNYPASTGIFGSLALGITTGPFGLLFGAGAVITPFIIKRLYGKYVYNEKNINNDLLDIEIAVSFMKEIVTRSLNIPSKVLYITKNVNDIIPNKKIPSRLSKTEVASLRGMAQEIAIMLFQMKVLFLMKLLLWDEDDDEDDIRKQMHNFIDNQTNRSMNALLMWSNPKTLIDDNSKFAILGYLGNILKLIKNVRDYATKNHGNLSDMMYNVNKVQPFIPIPNSVGKAIFKGEYPGLEKREYQSSQWFDEYIKGKEWKNKRKLQNRRSWFKEGYEELLRQKYEAKNIDEDKVDKIIQKRTRRRMNKFDLRKKPKEKYEQALDRIDFDKKLDKEKEKLKG